MSVDPLSIRYHRLRELTLALLDNVQRQPLPKLPLMIEINLALNILELVYVQLLVLVLTCLLI